MANISDVPLSLENDSYGEYSEFFFSDYFSLINWITPSFSFHKIKLISSNSSLERDIQYNAKGQTTKPSLKTDVSAYIEDALERMYRYIEFSYDVFSKRYFRKIVLLVPVS